jgi:hypothetical protein
MKKETKKPKLGSGKRFKTLAEQLESEGKSTDSAKAIAAEAGRAKYGDKKMNAMAKAGKARKK